MKKRPAKKKIVKKKTTKKKVLKAVPKPKRKKTFSPAAKKEKPIGRVTHYFGNIRVAIIKCKAPIAVGARLKFKGATTDFEEVLKSMQYEHKPITRSKKNQEVGVKVKGKTREGDLVFAVK